MFKMTSYPISLKIIIHFLLYDCMFTYRQCENCRLSFIWLTLLCHVLYKYFAPWRWVVLDKNQVKRVTHSHQWSPPPPSHACITPPWGKATISLDSQCFSHCTISEKIRDNFHRLEILFLSLYYYIFRKEKKILLVMETASIKNHYALNIKAATVTLFKRADVFISIILYTYI